MHPSQPSIPCGHTASTRIPRIHHRAADDAEEERQVEGQELGYLKGWKKMAISIIGMQEHTMLYIMTILITISMNKYHV